MINLNRIVISNTQPTELDTLWLKPEIVEGKVRMLLFAPIDKNRYVNVTSEDIAEAVKAQSDGLADILNKLRTDIENSKKDFSTISEDKEPLYYYGITWDTEVSGTKRIGNFALHNTLPLQSRMRRCLLDDDGNVITYLNSDDSTKLPDGSDAVLDGSNGQVMVELPDTYYKFVYEGTRCECRLSPYPIAGYKKWSKKYISAYEAALNRDNLKLSSVVNDTPSYRGGHNGAGWDGTYRSLLGRPATNISTVDFMTYARNRGTGWYCYTYEAHVQMFWLFAVEFNTFNSQADLGGTSKSYVTGAGGSKYARANTQGLMFGGLDAGVVNMGDSDWGRFNYYNPIIPCGHTNILGNKTGTVPYTVIDSAGSSLITFQVPSYRGVENPFGHIWKRTEGVKIIKENGTGQVYVSEDLTKQTLVDDNPDKANYRYAGALPYAQNWVKNIIGGEYGDILPSKIGGSGSSYFYDYLWTKNEPPTCACSFGGSISSGAFAGFVCVRAEDFPSYQSVASGSRLCFQPA